MKAYNDFRGFGAPAQDVMTRSRSISSASQIEPALSAHNTRGLVVAVMMSAACWAGIGLAFLL